MDENRGCGLDAWITLGAVRRESGEKGAGCVGVKRERSDCAEAPRMALPHWDLVSVLLIEGPG